MYEETPGCVSRTHENWSFNIIIYRNLNCSEIRQHYPLIIILYAIYQRPFVFLSDECRGIWCDSSVRNYGKLVLHQVSTTHPSWSKDEGTLYLFFLKCLGIRVSYNFINFANTQSTYMSHSRFTLHDLDNGMHRVELYHRLILREWMMLLALCCIAHYEIYT